MNNRKKLRRNLMVLLLTLVMLAAVTAAWFVNWASPFTDAMQFAGSTLNVDVTITEEDGSPLPSADGNALMILENMKPGDSHSYRVTIENRGAACTVYLGLSGIQNYRWSASAATYAAMTAGEPDQALLSDALRASVEEQTTDSPPAFTERAHQFIGKNKEFFFDVPFQLKEQERLQLRYVVRFEGRADETAAEGDGALANNRYALKKTTGLFTVTSTLAPN